MIHKVRKALFNLAIISAFLALALAIYFGASLNRFQLTSAEPQSVHAIAQELVARKLLPSISYAVIDNGEIVSSKTIGTADLASGDIANAQTLYEAASLTKPFIAELARRLFMNGVFDLDEKIADTISSNRIADNPRWRKVTPRHLLSHTSGLPNWRGDSRDPQRNDSLEFEFEPGSAFQYSGEGYAILLSFLEAKSGQSAMQLAANLFIDLGMLNSTLVGQDFAGHYARGHWAKSPGRDGWKTSEPIAAYSLFTTAEDYALFLQAVIAAHSIHIRANDPFPAVQTAIKTTRSGETLGWSLGWGTLQRASDIVYFQWGDNGAFRSFAAFDPASGTGIVYLTNGSFGTIYANDLAAPILGDISTASDWFSSETKEIARTWLRF